MPPILLAVINVTSTSDVLFPEQTNYILQIENLKLETNFEEFRTTLHILAWVSHTIPEVVAEINILSEVTKETYLKEDLKTINSLIKDLNLGLK